MGSDGQAWQTFLKNEPGQNVITFGNKVHDIAMRIQGMCSHPPEDLPSLVAKSFLACDVEAFCLTAICIHNKVDHKWDTANWQVIILDLKSKYHTCMTQGLWEPAKNQKKDSANELVSMKASLNKLVQKLDKSQSKNKSKGKKNKKNKKNMVDVMCHKCGKKGHFAHDCNADSPSGGVSGPKSAKKSNWKHVPPKDRETHSKHVNRDKFCWCKHCRRWTMGSKMHYTNNHKKKEDLPGPNPHHGGQAGVAA